MTGIDAHKFSSDLVELADILSSADAHMARLWKHASPEQRTRLDALEPFDYHDPMPVAKAAKALAEKIEIEATAMEQIDEDSAAR